MRRFIYYNSSAAAGCDVDALAFISAASITDPTQQAAICTLVSELKAFSLWTDLDVILPIVGGSAASHSYDLKTSTVKVTWNGGVTHNANGVLFNGSNAYGNVAFNAPNTYNRTAVESISNTNSNGWSGIFDGSAVFGQQVGKTGSQLGTVALGLNTLAGVSVANTAFGVRTMVIEANVTNGGKYYHDGTQIFQATPSGSPAGGVNNYFIGALNNSGSPILYNQHQQDFFAFGNALTATQVGDLVTIINTFNTAIGR